MKTRSVEWSKNIRIEFQKTSIDLFSQRTPRVKTQESGVLILLLCPAAFYMLWHQNLCHETCLTCFICWFVLKDCHCAGEYGRWLAGDFVLKDCKLRMMRGFTSRLVILKHCEGRTRVIPIRRLLRIQCSVRQIGEKVYTAKVNKNQPFTYKIFFLVSLLA